MKEFIRRAIVILILATIACSFLVRGVVDKLRDKVMEGFDSAAEIVSATLGDVLAELDLDADDVELPEQFARLFDSLKRVDDAAQQAPVDNRPLISDGKNPPSISVTDAGFERARYEFASDGCSAIHIDVKNCDIALTSGEVEKITVDVLENADFKYTFTSSSDSLEISDEQPGAKEVKLFGISLGTKEPVNTYTGLVMAVCIPESFKGEIRLSTTNGDLKLGGLALSERLTVSTTNGKLSLSDIEAYDIYADTTGGRIDLEGLSATEIFVSTTLDRITLTELTAKRIKATTNNASIDFSRLYGENFTFETTNGDISGSILGSQLLYHIETLTDRTAIPKSVDNPNAYCKLSAKTVGGDINIRFVE